MIDAQALHRWAHETFGHADLGHRRRTRRLVSMAAGLASGPAGTVTASFEDGGEREGAFRWLSNPEVSCGAVLDALGIAAFGRAQGRVYCAVDGTSLTLTDEAGSRNIGGIGPWGQQTRGIHAMTSVLVDESGAPLGVPGVQFWVRTKPTVKPRKQRQSLQSETRYGVELLGDIERRRATHAPDVRVHYLLDRGFDAWALFRAVRDESLSVTVRVRGDRYLCVPRGQKSRSIREVLGRAPRLGQSLLQMPTRHGRPGRLAVLDIRALRVSFPLIGEKGPCEMTAVWAKETGYRGRDALHWILLTTDEVTCLPDAQRVLDGYAFRWRIEELHRAWKAGWCSVEKTQLRGRDALYKWATLHLAVASRAIHLARRARSEPDVPATEEFSREEIDAVLLWQKKRTKARPGDTPPLGEVVHLVALLGGYTGKSSGGPPGPTVIGRGLEKIAVAAETIRILRAK